MVLLQHCYLVCLLVLILQFMLLVPLQLRGGVSKEDLIPEVIEKEVPT